MSKDQNAKPAVLVLGPQNFQMPESISDFASPVPFWAHDSLKACREASGADFRGLVTTGEKKVNREFMDSLPSLEVITCFGVGYDGIDVAAARERGIGVTNTPDVLTDTVAELAVGMTISARRFMVKADRYVRDGHWETDGPMHLAQQVNGTAVGIAGLGRIGEAIARMLEPFNCTIRYYGRKEKPDAKYEFVGSLVELARQSDILIVMLPGSAETDAIVDQEVIDALGDTGTLVNVSRGSVVNEEALVQALEQGRLGSAALDVFRNEPHVPQKLKDMSNVVLQPHTGSATWETRAAMRDLVVENLRRHFEGKELKTPVA